MMRSLVVVRKKIQSDLSFPVVSVAMDDLTLSNDHVKETVLEEIICDTASWVLLRYLQSLLCFCMRPFN